jgi:hypothetical protein
MNSRSGESNTKAMQFSLLLVIHERGAMKGAMICIQVNPRGYVEICAREGRTTRGN